MSKKTKIGDVFFFEKIEKLLRGIYDEDRTNIEGMVCKIQQSHLKFDSEFTETELCLFMDSFGPKYDSEQDNKMFFLFKTKNGISASCAVSFMPLKPRKNKTIQLTHIGFNNKWYCVEDFAEIFMEEVQYTVLNLKLVTGVALSNHIYSYVTYNT